MVRLLLAVVRVVMQRQATTQSNKEHDQQNGSYATHERILLTGFSILAQLGGQLPLAKIERESVIVETGANRKHHHGNLSVGIGIPIESPVVWPSIVATLTPQTRRE